MSFPNITFWSNLLGTVGIEVCVVVALGIAAQSAFRRAYWKRAMWQMTLLCLILISASEWTGAGRGAVSSLFGKKRVEHTDAPQTLSPNIEIYTTKSVSAVSTPLPAPEKPVWWPGLIWLAGTVIVLGRMAMAQGLLFLLRFRREKIVDSDLQERVARVAKMLGLRRKVCLLRLPESISPMAFGILFPTIGLPPGFEMGFSAMEQDAILAHELAHLAALDPLWFRLADFASALLWWHPLAWWARRSLHGASELAADEATALVPDGPGSLAHCLVSLGKKMTLSRGWGWTGINGGFRSKLGKRVERLTRLSAGHGKPFAGWIDRLVRLIAMLLIVPSIVLLFGAFQTAKGEKENAWRNAWTSSPGMLLAMAVAEETDSHADKPVIDGLIQDAKLLYEKDKFDEAELILVHVLKHDPSNKTAAHYLAIIKEADTESMQSKLLMIWAEHEVATQAKYLNYSNILYNLGKLPETKFGAELLTTYTNLADSELKEKSARLSYAKEVMTAVKAEYGTENPKYKKALEEFQQAKDDYDNKAVAIFEGIRARVDGESNFLQIIKQKEEDIKTRYKQQTEISALERANQTTPQETIAERIKNAKLLYEMGKLSESKKILTQILKDDPSNGSAAYYMDLIKETQLAKNAEAKITTVGRDLIISKLNTLTMDSVDYELPLTSVLARLRVWSQKADSTGLGIKFLIDGYDDNYSAMYVLPNPHTDMGSVNIKISPALHNLRLNDVLNAIVMTADHPIEYTIKDYGVVFSPKPADTLTLYSTTFHVDPTAFVQGLQQSTGMSLNPGTQTSDNAAIGSNNTIQLDTMVRTYFTSLGVNLTDPGKSIFSNARLGLFLVRATAGDLQLVEQGVNQLNQTPRQITIEGRFVDLSKEEAKALGFNLDMVDGDASLITVISDKQFRAALDNIKNKSHEDLLAAPKVTTLSGRQAHISSTNDSGDGPVLDVIATVRADGFSIQILVIASVSENGQKWEVTEPSRRIMDGQTLVMGKLLTEPVSGAKKWRFVFVSPTIIDAVGNRVHSDEELSNKH